MEKSLVRESTQEEREREREEKESNKRKEEKRKVPRLCVPGPYHDPVQRPSIVAHAAEGELLTRELTSKTFGRLLIGAVKRGEEHCRGRVSNIDRNGGEIRHVPWIPRFANNFVIHEFSRVSVSLRGIDRKRGNPNAILLGL